MKRFTLKRISSAIAARDYQTACDVINDQLDNDIGVNWRRDLTKLRDFLIDGIPRFSVFAKNGNGKLPFLAFSSLPGSGFCIGAGDCLDWCYSFRAWRYPAAFCRQAQNAALLQSMRGRGHILMALDEFKPESGQIDFRLYVDGDFTGVFDIAFWFRALDNRQWLKAYGYSKSWQAFLDYDGVIPTNYLLNLSSGSKYSEAIKNKLKKLPFVRGEFKAVSLGRKVRSADHGDRSHQSQLRAAYGKKAFTCPGHCGDCTKSGHACGSDRFNDVDIIIAVH